MGTRVSQRARRAASWLLLSALGIAPAWAEDPGLPDPTRPVTRQVYDYGDEAFVPSPFQGTPARVEVSGSVHAPTNLGNDPLPLLVLMHGSHWTCGAGNTVVVEGVPAPPWPCSSPSQRTASYEGFDYLAESIASHGYIVVSISADGIAAGAPHVGGDPAQLALARAELLQEHLDRWETFHFEAEPIFEGRFKGLVDLSRVGTLGHSDGADGVVRHVALNAGLGSPYGLRAVLPVAPTGAPAQVVNGVPLAALLPYCDAVATSLPGVRLFDDARYPSPGDETPKHTIALLGANHNHFNAVWSGVSGDDWLGGIPSFLGLPGVTEGSQNPHCGPSQPGSGRLTAEQQRAAAAAYVAAFFRLYVGHEDAFTPLLRGDVGPPASAQEADVQVAYHAPAGQRLDIHRGLDAGALNTAGGFVVPNGLAVYEACGATASCTSAPGDREPHTPGTSMLRLVWTQSGASLLNTLPAGLRDTTGYDAVQLRVAVDFDDPANALNQPLDFQVTLVEDGTGATASVPASRYSDALFFPPGLPDSGASPPHPVPRILLHTVRIPLAAFRGIDPTKVSGVVLDFDSDQGAILLADLAYADPPRHDDPGLPNPAVEVEREEYGTNDPLAFVPSTFDPGFATEVMAVVHRPKVLDAGPYPLVIVAHGDSPQTCIPYDTDWPCPQGSEPFPHHIGFDDFGEVLASHGYIVASLSMNGILNARTENVDSSFGIQSGAELIQEHLDLWADFDAGNGELGATYMGKVDMTNVALVGHSKGGGRVTKHFEQFVASDPSYPYGVQALVSLAGVHPGSGFPNELPVAAILAYCDNDIKELFGFQLFDDGRYDAPDLAPAYTVLTLGGNHNWFNARWLGDDFTYSDNPHCATASPTSGRLTREEQQSFLTAYLSGFLRRHLGGEQQFAALLRGETDAPRSVPKDDVHVTYHGTTAVRRDVHRMTNADPLAQNHLGGAVTVSGLSEHSSCGVSVQSCVAASVSLAREPHRNGLAAVRLGWSSPGAFYQNGIPIGQRDLAGYRALRLRVSVDVEDVRNPVGVAQDFQVVLVDESGSEESVPVSRYSDALFFPPGLGGTSSGAPVPKLAFNGIRIPLAAFRNVDLTRISELRFEFDTPSGAIVVSDIAFVDPPLPECSDGLDNDGDGLVDHPEDGGCKNASSPEEAPNCDDGFDNDGDGLTDHPDDPQCTSGSWWTEDPLPSCGLGFELAPLLLLVHWGGRRAGRGRVTR